MVIRDSEGNIRMGTSRRSISAAYRSLHLTLTSGRCLLLLGKNDVLKCAVLNKAWRNGIRGGLWRLLRDLWAGNNGEYLRRMSHALPEGLPIFLPNLRLSSYAVFVFDKDPFSSNQRRRRPPATYRTSNVIFFPHGWSVTQ